MFNWNPAERDLSSLKEETNDTNRKGVLEISSEENPRLRVDLVQAWRFVAPAVTLSAGKLAPHHGSYPHPTTVIADLAPLFSQCLNAPCQPTSQG